MKICLINNLYPPYDRGGAEQVLQRIVEGLLAAGHDVIILTASPHGDEVQKNGNLTIYGHYPGNLYFYTDGHRHSILTRGLWHLIDMFHWGTADWARKIIEQEKPDVVHTHNLMGLSFLIPSMLRRMKIPHVHTVHDTQLVEPSAIILKREEYEQGFRSLSRKVYASVMRRLMGSPDIVISPSQFLLDFYTSRHFFPKSERLMLRNPVTFTFLSSRPSLAASGDIPFIPPASDLGDKNWNDKANVFRFLYVGQIEQHKGILLLVDAFKELVRQEHVPCELHIAGNGSLFEEVQSRAKECRQIFLYGRVDRTQLPALFSKMDMLVVPSLCYENSPTVIFESLSSAVPILASNMEGIAELISVGENGVTFEAGNVKDLIEKMRWCLVHQDEVKKMSAQCARYVKGLSPEEYIGRLLELYQSRL